MKILKSLDDSHLSFSDIVLQTGCNWVDIRDMLIELEHQNLLSVYIDDEGVIRYKRI